MRIVLFCNDDLTTNIIFAPLFDVPQAEIVGVYFAASVSKKHTSKWGGAFAMIRKMDWRYWLYLMFSNGLFKLFEWLALSFALAPRSGDCVSLRRLAQKRGIPCHDIQDFSSPDLIAQIRALHPELLLIRVGAILSEQMLDVPSRATWCVHSSLLPSFKGIAGEFHALNTPQAPIGSTVFKVTPVLDAGPPIGQIAIERDERSSVFQHMLRNNKAAAGLLKDMVERSIGQQALTYPLPGKELPESYYSWPSTAQVRHFLERGKTLISFAEMGLLILQALHLRARPLTR